MEKNIQETGGKDIAFNNILRTMNESGQFKASFLVDVQGMPVASVSNGEDTDAAGAMAAQLHELVEQTQSRIHLGGAEEVAVRSNDRMRLVSRYFNLGEQTLILVVVMSPERTYRKLTSQAIRELRQVWAE
jgi:predicted regulator of Ras-like GTPase activity (Roadblock/LC7/MglB family)